MLTLSIVVEEDAEGAVLKVGPGETYTKVQDAIDDASAGDTIKVMNGTYYGDISIDLDITLDGSGMDKTIIDGSGTGDAVTVQSDDVTISNLTIKGSKDLHTKSALLVDSSKDCTISYVNISGLSSIGISLTTGSDNARIEHCVVKNDYSGILIQDSSDVVVESCICSSISWYGILLYSESTKCLIVNNTLYNNRYGILLDSKANNNTIRSNDVRYCSWGGIAIASSCWDNLVQNNIAVQNQGGISNGGPCSIIENNNCSFNTGSGIGAGGAGALVANNYLANNTMYGINIDLIVNLTVENNTCINNRYGIWTSSVIPPTTMNCTIRNNTCTKSTYDGIRISGGRDYLMVEYNNISSNGRYGISLVSANNVTVRGNIVHSNRQEGIILDHWTSPLPDHGGNVVLNNTVTNHTLSGILVDTQNSIVANNTVRLNDGGIQCSCYDILIEGNLCENNTDTGIAVSKGWGNPYDITNITIRNNTCRYNSIGIGTGNMIDGIIEYNLCNDNSYAGINVYGVNCTIEGNECSYNSMGAGLNAGYGRPNYNHTFVNNTCSDNRVMGIYINEAHNNTIIGNTCHRNGEDGIRVHESNNNLVIYNSLMGNARYGIYVTHLTVNNVVKGNTLWNGTKTGIFIFSTRKNCVVEDNSVDGYEFGIFMDYGEDVTVRGNWVKNCTIGIRVHRSDITTIYNNWIECTTNYNETSSTNTLWNITKTPGRNICGGGCLGGNYWSDYTGVDLDEDGFGDTNLPHGPGDWLPLMKDTIRPKIEDVTKGNPTTGDGFLLQVNVTDNGMMRAVRVSYWFGSGPMVNTTMVWGSGDVWNWTVEVASDETEDLWYLISAVDEFSNWNATIARNLAVLDNDLPWITDNGTSVTPTTGDPFNFSMEVVDNIGIARAWVEYWYVGSSHSNLTMDLGGDSLWRASILVEHTDLPLTYKFHAEDTSGNLNRSVSEYLNVIDNDDPSITDWNPVNSVGTGGVLQLAMRAEDNLGISLAEVEYWFGNGSHMSAQMAKGIPGWWEHSIDIPLDSLELLNLFYRVFDAHGNVDLSPELVVSVFDGVPPTIDSDETPDSVTSGGSLAFSMRASDNIGVEEAWVEYRVGEEETFNETMTPGENGSCTHTVTVPLIVGTLVYNFHVRDVAGNWAVSESTTIPVFDGGNPLIISDTSPKEAFTGGQFLFGVDVTDDIGVAGVTVGIDPGDGSEVSLPMEQLAGTSWRATTTVPLDAEGPMRYRFHAEDASGNQVWSAWVEVPIIDDRPPSLGTIVVETAMTYMGDQEIRVDVTDNILVSEVWAVFRYPSGTEDNLTMSPLAGDGWGVEITFDELGEYTFVVWAIDGAGNTASDEGPQILVRDVLPPVIGAPDVSPTNLTAGDEVRFFVEVTDDHSIETVCLVLTSPDGGTTNETLDPMGQDEWTLDRVLGSTGEYSYVVKAVDGSGNWNFTAARSITVNDVDGNGGEEPDGETSSGVPPWVWYAVIALIVVVAIVAGLLGRERMRKGSED